LSQLAKRELVTYSLVGFHQEEGKEKERGKGQEKVVGPLRALRYETDAAFIRENRKEKEKTI
jgi:hypothetical protein